MKEVQTFHFLNVQLYLKTLIDNNDYMGTSTRLDILAFLIYQLHFRVAL